MTRNRHMLLMRTSWVWTVSARSRKIATISCTTDPMETNQWWSKNAAWFPLHRRTTPALFLYLSALPGCCVRGVTIYISVLSVCLFVPAPTLYFWCVYVCLYVSVYVCVSVYVWPPRLRSESWCARKTGAVARPIPKADLLPFVIEFIKASCVCAWNTTTCCEMCEISRKILTKCFVKYQNIKKKFYEIFLKTNSIKKTQARDILWKYSQFFFTKNMPYFTQYILFFSSIFYIFQVCHIWNLGSLLYSTFFGHIKPWLYSNTRNAM